MWILCLAKDSVLFSLKNNEEAFMNVVAAMIGAFTLKSK